MQVDDVRRRRRRRRAGLRVDAGSRRSADDRRRRRSRARDGDHDRSRAQRFTSAYARDTRRAPRSASPHVTDPPAPESNRRRRRRRSPASSNPSSRRPSSASSRSRRDTGPSCTPSCSTGSCRRSRSSDRRNPSSPCTSCRGRRATPGPGTQRPPMHASVELGQSAALEHGGPMLTVIVLVPTVPCASVALTRPCGVPPPSVAGALKPYGWVMQRLDQRAVDAELDLGDRRVVGRGRVDRKPGHHVRALLRGRDRDDRRRRRAGAEQRRQRRERVLGRAAVHAARVDLVVGAAARVAHRADAVDAVAAARIRFVLEVPAPV